MKDFHFLCFSSGSSNIVIVSSHTYTTVAFVRGEEEKISSSFRERKVYWLFDERLRSSSFSFNMHGSVNFSLNAKKFSRGEKFLQKFLHISNTKISTYDHPYHARSDGKSSSDASL